MGRCGGSCGCDYGSKAPQAPSLTDMTVVEDILRQAASNMLERYRAVEAGTMTESMYQDKAQYLAKWWSTCLEGGHPTYTIDDEWHRVGLPDLLREKLQLGSVDDQSAIYQGALYMVGHMHEWCRLAQSPDTSPMQAHQALEELITFWSGVYVGAPFVWGDES